NGGFAVEPYFVTQVDGNAGTVTYYKRSAPAPKRVIDAVVNRDMLAMLWNVVVFGTGNASRLPGRESGGKTGTTQDSHDAWFMGFTTDYVTGVWVGNDDNSPTRGVTGGTLPAQIWKSTMLVAEKGLPMKPLDRSPPQPPNEPSLFASGFSDSGGAAVRGDDEAAPPEGPADEQETPRRHRGG